MHQFEDDRQDLVELAVELLRQFRSEEVQEKEGFRLGFGRLRLTDQEAVDLLVLFGSVRDVGELLGLADELDEGFELDVFVESSHEEGQGLDLDGVVGTNYTQIGGRQLVALLTLLHLHALYLLQVLH